ncbi:hypothetical protein GALL_445650 [mine drainage metagenome]|uniref:Uncharacterized protein n=1 Tax=mine drainage metagenome TaxID=410659 RepID=A0A1J5PSK5_9ZZZZ
MPSSGRSRPRNASGTTWLCPASRSARAERLGSISPLRRCLPSIRAAPAHRGGTTATRCLVLRGCRAHLRRTTARPCRSDKAGVRCHPLLLRWNWPRSTSRKDTTPRPNCSFSSASRWRPTALPPRGFFRRCSIYIGQQDSRTDCCRGRSTSCSVSARHRRRAPTWGRSSRAVTRQPASPRLNNLTYCNCAPSSGSSMTAPRIWCWTFRRSSASPRNSVSRWPRHWPA